MADGKKNRKRKIKTFEIFRQNGSPTCQFEQFKVTKRQQRLSLLLRCFHCVEIFR